MATLWSMVVEWSVLSAEFPTKVPRAKTAAHLTCTRAHTHTHTRVINITSKSIPLQGFGEGLENSPKEAKTKAKEANNKAKEANKDKEANIKAKGANINAKEANNNANEANIKADEANKKIKVKGKRGLEIIDLFS